MNKRIKARILKLWKEGRNVWEISQLTGVSEQEIMDIVRRV